MNNAYGIPDHMFNGTMPPGGLSWTLTTLTGEMFTELEERYGARDKSWTLLGVEFYKDGPDIWYPRDKGKPHPRHIAIRLSPAAFRNYKEAMYQLSHECVHLLSPSGGKNAPVIEEGLAKLYSMEIIARHCGHPPGQNYGNVSAYDHAAGYVHQLLQIDGEAIRKLRQVQPAFYLMSADTFAAAGLQVPEVLVAALLAGFSPETDGAIP